MGARVLGRVSRSSVAGNISFEKEVASAPVGEKRVVTASDADYKELPPLVFSVSTDNLSGGGQTHGSELAFVVDEIMQGQGYGPRLSINPEGISQLGASSTIDKLIDRATPRDKMVCIRMAQEYADKDDFLGGVIDMLIDFTMTGFDLQVSVSQPSGEEKTLEQKHKISVETENFLNKFQEVYDFKKVIKDLARDRKITDSMILYWRIDKDATPIDTQSPIPNLTALYALNPSDVDWCNSFGMNILKVRIPEDIIYRVRNSLEQARVSFALNDTLLMVAPLPQPIMDLVNSGIPLKWIEAIRVGEKMVELSNEDGDYWIVSTKQRMNYGLAKPSMQRIFLSVETRQSLMQGEFTAGFMTKHFIMLVQQGESIDAGPLAGQRTNWLKPKDADALFKKFSDTTKAMRMVADHTLKITFVYPDAKIFGIEKYVAAESRILNWAGAVVTVVTGEGGNYGSAFIGIKRMISSISERRCELSDITTKFFNHPTIAKYVPSEEETNVIVVFDEQVLKEPAQLLKEIELLIKSSFIDPRTALRTFGYNPDRIRDSKFRSRQEDESDKSWSPMQNLENQNNQNSGADTGLNSPSKIDEGGRPANPSTTPNPGTRLQSPSPQS